MHNNDFDKLAPAAHSHHTSLFNKLRRSGLWAAAGLVAACGGGGGAGSDPLADVPETPSAYAEAVLPENVRSLPDARPDCRQLITTTYRFVAPQANGNFADVTGLMEVDVSAMTSTLPDGTVFTWVRNPGMRACEFVEMNGNGQIVVSDAGVIVGRLMDVPLIAFPDPVLDNGKRRKWGVHEVAANWTALGQAKKGSAFENIAADIAIATNGVIARIEMCSGLPAPPCPDRTTTTGAALAPNADDAFDLALPGRGLYRVFAYQSGGGGGFAGELMMVMVKEDGSFLLMSRRRTRTLPAQTAVLEPSWHLPVSAQLVARPLERTAARIDGSNSSAQAFQRTVETPGATDAHPETVFVNKPYTGYHQRPRATVALTSAAGSFTYPDSTLMPLRGMGVSVVALTESNEFLFSVEED